MAPPVWAALVVLVVFLVDARWGPLDRRLLDWTHSVWVALLVPAALEIVVLGWLTWRWGRRLSDRWWPTSRHALAGVVTLAVAIPLEAIAAHVVGLGVPGGEQTQPFELAPGPIMVLAVIAAPVLEELVFRGWLLGALTRTRLGGAGAVVVSGLAFGAAHVLSGVYGPIGFASTTMFGLAAAVAVLVTGSLVPGIVAHATGNLLGGLVALGHGDLAALLFLIVMLVGAFVMVAWHSRGRNSATVAAAVETDERWAHVEGTVKDLAARYKVAPAPAVGVRQSLPRGQAAVRTGLRRYTIVVADDAVQHQPVEHVDIAIARLIDDAAHRSRRLLLYELLAVAAGILTAECLSLGLMASSQTSAPALRWWLLGLALTVPGGLAAWAQRAREARRRALDTDRRLVDLFTSDAVADQITAHAARQPAWRTTASRALGPLVGEIPAAERAGALRGGAVAHR
jgi:membrane protease YdiL (CAAX protease family)